VKEAHRALDQVLRMEGWRAWILGGDDRVIAGLGAHVSRVEPGRCLDEILGPLADAARTALAELEAGGSASPRRVSGVDPTELMVFNDAIGRAVAVRSLPVVQPSPEAERAEVLLRAAQALGGANSVSEVLAVLVAAAVDSFGDGAGVWCLDGPERLVLREWRNLPVDALAVIEEGPATCWEALKAGAPLVTGDVREDSRFLLHPSDRQLREGRARAIALIPLRAGGQDQGVLAVSWERRGLPSTEALRALQELVSIAAVALERAAAADALASHHRLLQAVLDASSDGILGVGGGGQVVLSNLRAQRLLERDEADLAEQGWLDRFFEDPEERLAVLQQLAASPTTSQGDPVDLTLLRSDGARRDLLLTSTSLAGPGGEKMTLVFLRDVTERLRARARSQAEQNFSRLGRLAGGIAHDFNNLLGAILGHADLIRNSSGADGAVIQRATTIAEAAVRGSRLSNRLLAFSGKGTIRPQALDLAQEVERGVRLFRPTLRPAVHLRTTVDEGLTPVLVDPGQLYQALVNLLANAREAVGSEGCIGVGIDRATLPEGCSWVASELDTSQELLRLAVVDSGPGFTEEALTHLFEPYFTTRTDGHGLGLSAVQGIVAAHGGALNVYNSDDGAVVEIYLPVVASSRRAGPHPAERRIRQEVIWAVDDEPFLLEFIEAALSVRGFQVKAFTDPVQALEAARAGEGPPDLLLLDVVMPELTGPQLLAELRMLEAYATLPVVWSSGYSPDSVELGAGEEAVFLQKPYTGRELSATLRDVLGG